MTETKHTHQQQQQQQHVSFNEKLVIYTTPFNSILVTIYYYYEEKWTVLFSFPKLVLWSVFECVCACVCVCDGVYLSKKSLKHKKNRVK